MKKLDLENSKLSTDSKFGSLEQELHSLRASSRLFEEKLKLAESERNKLEANYQDQLRALSADSVGKESSLTKQLAELKSKARLLEEEV